MDTLWSGISLADIHTDAARNIVSLRDTENLFDDLSDDSVDQQVGVEHEMRTKPAFYTNNAPIINRPFEEAEWQNAIGYPFDEWSVSRYSNGHYGVWYGGDSIETTLYETAYHWRMRLADANWETDGSEIERKVYWVACDAWLLDFRPLVNDYPALVHETDYMLTQQIGARINREKHPGLVTQSARCDGEVYAVFNPEVLSNPRVACYFTYRLESGRVHIQRQIGTDFMVI